MTPPERSAFTDLRRTPRAIPSWTRSDDSPTLRWNTLSRTNGNDRRPSSGTSSTRAPAPASTRRWSSTTRASCTPTCASARWSTASAAPTATAAHLGPLRTARCIYSLARMGYTDIIWVYDRSLTRLHLPDAAASSAPRNYAFEDLAVDSCGRSDPLAGATCPRAPHVAHAMRESTFPLQRRLDGRVITATVPVRSFLAGAELAGPLPISVQLDVHDPASPHRGSRSAAGQRVRAIPSRSASTALGPPHRARTQRGADGRGAGRCEARPPTAQVDAAVDTSSGFGISDLLAGHQSPARPAARTPRAGATSASRPPPGSFRGRNRSAWSGRRTISTPVERQREVYKVNLQLARTFEGTMKGFVARIAAYTKNVIERDGSGTGWVAVTYEQSRPASPSSPISSRSTSTAPYRAATG